MSACRTPMRRGSVATSACSARPSWRCGCPVPPPWLPPPSSMRRRQYPPDDQPACTLHDRATGAEVAAYSPTHGLSIGPELHDVPWSTLVAQFELRYVELADVERMVAASFAAFDATPK